MDFAFKSIWAINKIKPFVLNFLINHFHYSNLTLKLYFLVIRVLNSGYENIIRWYASEFMLRIIKGIVTLDHRGRIRKGIDTKCDVWKLEGHILCFDNSGDQFRIFILLSLLEHFFFLGFIFKPFSLIINNNLKSLSNFSVTFANGGLEALFNI